MLTGLVSDYLFVSSAFVRTAFRWKSWPRPLRLFFFVRRYRRIAGASSAGGDMGGRLLLTDAEGKGGWTAMPLCWALRLEPQVVAALTQSTGSAYGIHPLTDATGPADEAPGNMCQRLRRTHGARKQNYRYGGAGVLRAGIR